MSRFGSPVRLRKPLWTVVLAIFLLTVMAPLGLAKEKTAAQRRPLSKPPTVQRAMKEQRKQAKRDRAHRRKLEAFHARPKVRL